MIPFANALDFFKGLWEVLPLSVRAFVTMCVILVVVVAVVKLVLDL